MTPWIPEIWNPTSYAFWYVLISAGCVIAERLAPWRPRQPLARRQIGQDLFWFAFNGHYLGVLLVYLTGWWWSHGGAALERHLHLLGHLPWWGQFALAIVIKDFCEWGVHNLLHRVPWLWKFHKLHHSITEMDWLGNMRFHWLEVVVYRSLLWLPVAILDLDWHVALAMAAVSTLIGHLNHANLRLDWGPLRYVLNSSRFHIWHHERIAAGSCGTNFAIIFTTWDWLFGTAHFPVDRDQPDELGFSDLNAFPTGLLGRLLLPLRVGAPADADAISKHDPEVR